jgi:hypothetical protein
VSLYPRTNLRCFSSSLYQMLDSLLIQLDTFSGTKNSLQFLKELPFRRVPEHNYVRIKRGPKHHTSYRQVCNPLVKTYCLLGLKVGFPCLIKCRVPPGIKIGRPTQFLLALFSL